jgi:ssRNA-specific RNase YbeY (16S rRNA maturation enzyme)
MGERRNTIVCAFDHKSPRISAYNIHEWIYTQMRPEENEVTMAQIDGPKRQVNIKFRDNNRPLDVLNLTGEQVECRHTNGEISICV